MLPAQGARELGHRAQNRTARPVSVSARAPARILSGPLRAVADYLIAAQVSRRGAQAAPAIFAQSPRKPAAPPFRPTPHSWQRFTRSIILSLALMANACAPQGATARPTPESFSPLVQKVLPAVVNIAVWLALFVIGAAILFRRDTRRV